MSWYEDEDEDEDEDAGTKRADAAGRTCCAPNVPYQRGRSAQIQGLPQRRRGGADGVHLPRLGRGAWADCLFMLGLLGIGLALASGVALRLTAVAGTVMMALMWAAEWPPARHLSDSTPSMSTNPFVEYHVLYAAVLITLAVSLAGRTWGLGRMWGDLPFVRRNRWLL